MGPMPWLMKGTPANICSMTKQMGKVCGKACLEPGSAVPTLSSPPLRKSLLGGENPFSILSHPQSPFIQLVPREALSLDL